MQRFLNKVVAITGGANGIGLAKAKRFVEEGAKVALLDLARPEQDVRGALSVQGDCTDGRAVGEFFRDVASTLGDVDILFNNVGQSARARKRLFVDSTENTSPRSSGRSTAAPFVNRY